MSRRPIIAILRGITPPEAPAVGAALVEAGIDLIEVPLNSPDAFVSIGALVATLPQAQVGAGTVLSVMDVGRVADLGGHLIVSPNTDKDVIRATRAASMESYPGVMTPTEAFNALAAGATALKLFPGELIGPQGLKALRAVLPASAQCYAVGGVTALNMEEWRRAGASGCGIGSAIYRPGDDAVTVREKARALVAAWDATG